MDMRIGASICMRAGYVAAYNTIAQADAQARQLQLTGLYAETRAFVAHCLLHADNRPPPTPPERADQNDDRQSDCRSPCTWTSIETRAMGYGHTRISRMV